MASGELVDDCDSRFTAFIDNGRYPVSLHCRNEQSGILDFAALLATIPNSTPAAVPGPQSVKLITVTVEGGVVQSVDDIPQGIAVEIIDLDEDADSGHRFTIHAPARVSNATL